VLKTAIQQQSLLHALTARHNRDLEVGKAERGKQNVDPVYVKCNS